MPINVVQARQFLRNYDFISLFVDVLGWDRYTTSLPITIGQQPFFLRAVAQKRGMIAYTCPPGGDGRIPPQQVRRAIEQQVDRVVREHIIVFSDSPCTEMIWLWVRRGADQPAALREYHYSPGRSGDSLVQRLNTIAFSLEEEADLTLTDVISRTRAAFDVDRITRRFYDGYKVEHAAFQTTLEGIPDVPTQRWYAQPADVHLLHSEKRFSRQ